MQTDLPEVTKDEMHKNRRNKKTVAIVGMHRTTRANAPWDDEDCEIWGLNEALRLEFMKRWTRWFQMHSRLLFTRIDNPNDPNHFDWLREPHNFPIYMIDKFPDIPASVSYPIKEAIRFVGINYFASTVAYMFTLAMLDGFERIELFGINMGSDTEYAYQRANMEYLIGFARGRGIEVYIPQLSNLCKGRMYGYDSSMTGLRQKLEYRLRETNAQIDENKKKAYAKSGYQKVFLDLEIDYPALKKSQSFQALKEKAIIDATEAYNLYMLTNGANQEMGHIMNMFDAFVANSEDMEVEDGTKESSFS